jgi:hypothetical protein
MPKYTASLTNTKPGKDGKLPEPVVIEAADAPAAKAKAIAQLKPEASQDVEVVEVVEATA